jgi:hypothetical protein
MTMPKYTQLLGDQPPAYINLPDGRRIALSDITTVRQNYRVIRLTRRNLIGVGRPTKYTDEERRWILTASLSQVQERYNLAHPTQAWWLIRDSHMRFNIQPPNRKTWPK